MTKNQLDKSLSSSAIKRRAMLERYLNAVDCDILEIGALDNPTYLKTESNILYLDWITYEEALEKYKSKKKKRERYIVRPDFVVNGINMRDVIRTDEVFDLIIANHAIEHFPNPIRFLKEAAYLVSDGGFLFLSIPDKRFTFDFNRIDTDFIDWYRRFVLNQDKPDYWDIIRHMYYKVDYNRKMYDAGITPDPIKRYKNFSQARKVSEELYGGYADVHVSVFTKESFASLWWDLQRSGLLPWVLVEIDEPTTGDNEFRVLLKKSL